MLQEKISRRGKNTKTDKNFQEIFLKNCKRTHIRFSRKKIIIRPDQIFPNSSKISLEQRFTRRRIPQRKDIL